MLKNICYLLILSVLTACSGGGGGGSSAPSAIDPKFLSSTGSFSSVVSSVVVSKDVIKVNGELLDKIEFVRVVKNGTSHDLIIDKKEPNLLWVKTKDTLKFAMGETFSILVGNVYGQTVYTANFELEDRTIQINHIAGALGGVGVTTGQVLKWNGTDWAPSTLGALTYLGTWNASTNTPDISALAIPEKGSFYIVNASGSTDLNGITSWTSGEWAVYGDSGWEKISTSAPVSSVFGRAGAVTAQSNDYTWAQINKTVSSIGDISDINLMVAPSDGQVLKYDSATSKWIPANDNNQTSVGSSDIDTNSITDTHIANGAISQTKINNLASDLAGKENSITTGTTAQYFRGDKTWHTLDTNNVTEGSNLYFTETRARTASVVDAIVDGVLNIAPSQNAVHDALAAKLNQSSFVDWGTSGIQTIDPSRIDLAANNRAVITNGSGLISVSNVTATELSYVSGVTSAIQNQINMKQNTLTAGSINSSLIQDGTITNDDIDGNISQSKIENLTSDLSNKQDISTLADDVRSIALSGLSLATNAAITATDTILSAFGKLQKQITDLDSVVLKNGGTIGSDFQHRTTDANTLSIKNMTNPTNPTLAIGRDEPTQATVEIGGSITTFTRDWPGDTNTINLLDSNTHVVPTYTAGASSALTFNNMADGASYKVVIKQNSGVSKTFTYTFNKREGGAIAGGEVRWIPAMATTTASKHIVLNFMRVGNSVYGTWMEF